MLLGSFYCRLYIADQLTKLRSEHGEDPDLTTILLDQLDKAEELKRRTTSGPNALPPFRRQDFQDFCLGVFKRAVDEDSDGSETTLQRFYCAGLFFDVYTQFGSLPPDLEEKRKYSRWRALAIKKALANGEQPPAPPASSSGRRDDATPFTCSPKSSSVSVTATPSSGSGFQSINKGDDKRHDWEADPPEDTRGSLGEMMCKLELKDVKGVDKALKHAQMAVSALNFDDVQTGKEQLTAALNCLC